MQGHLYKMAVQLSQPVGYQLRLDDQKLDLNPFVGQRIAFRHTGHIHCQSCGRKTKKSYSQGYCYPCMIKLAQCDMCIVKPELCHFDQGTCREPEWGERHCMTHHYVYLSNTSGLKVGITREQQLHTRWIDQGAVQAIPLARVQTRHQSGLVEIELGKLLNDKTNWRAMLKGEPEPVDLRKERDQILLDSAPVFNNIRLQFGEDAIELQDAEPVCIDYPVLEYPKKITSFNLDKNPLVEGTLLGIKGQYLLLDTGVINLRKYTSYEIEWISA